MEAPELSDEEFALLESCSDDWYSLQESTKHLTIITYSREPGLRKATEIQIPTEETLRSLHAKGLIRIAWVSHKDHPPDERDIPGERLDEVFADAKNWKGPTNYPDGWSVEYTTSAEGERVLDLIWRQRNAQADKLAPE